MNADREAGERTEVDASAISWQELRVAGLDGECAEAVHELFQRYAPERTVFEELRPADAERGRPLADRCRFVVRAFVEESPSGAELRRSLEQGYFFLSRIRELPALELHSVANVDWTQEWRRAHVALPVGERLWIVPGHGESAPPGRLTLVMEPGSAFGLGTHPTTRLALELLESCVRSGMAVADVGCGSGILGMAALLLGAKSVTAVDLDPAAVRATRHSALDNGFESALRVEVGSTERLLETYDLLAMNIVVSVIERLVGEVVARLAPGGSLVLSGMMSDNVHRVRERLSAFSGCIEDEREEGDWCALLWRRANSRPTPAQTSP